MAARKTRARGGIAGERPLADAGIADLKARLDLVEVAGRCTELKRQGRVWWGRCDLRHQLANKGAITVDGKTERVWLAR